MQRSFTMFFAGAFALVISALCCSRLSLPLHLLVTSFSSILLHIFISPCVLGLHMKGILKRNRNSYLGN